MMYGSKQVMGAAIVCLLGGGAATSQPAQKPLMAEDVFKNVQVLKGIPVNQFMETMSFFSASLGYNCTNCHVADSLGNWEKYAEDVPAKRMARVMIVMVNSINKSNFGGRGAVSCYSCHRGAGHPKIIPSLAEQYGTPPPEDPNEIEIAGQAPAGPSADQILDKYIQALGGADRLASLTSFAAKGTYGGWDTDFQKVPVEIFAKAPGQRATIAHTRLGDDTTAYDGRAGWIAGPDKPVPVLAVPAGEDLDGVKLDADLSFPGLIKQALGRWRVGFPETAIDDHEVEVVQGTTAGGSRVKLFFDKMTGLLVRLVRYTTTVVGIVPTQIDYSDYREVAGVKMPFHWTMTWTSGQSTTELSEVQANVPVDAGKFGKPKAPPRP
jgi:photosynthetic reaction center cytochrome c subunit